MLQGKKNPDDPVVQRFKDCIDDFKQIMPVVEELANPALKKRHWCVPLHFCPSLLVCQGMCVLVGVARSMRDRA